MSIKDFIGNKIESGVFHEGTFGIEIETETLESYKIPSFTFWDVKNDGSLRNFGKEYVLKVPLRFENEVPAALEEFEVKTKKVPFITDSISTSTHLHLNFLYETWRTFGNYLTLYTLTENLLIEYSGEFRRNNLFCLPIRSVPIIQQMMVKLFATVAKKNYNLKTLLNQEQIKYSAGNLGTLLRFGSFEVRSMRGLTKKDEIQDWVSIHNDMLEFSRQDVTPCVIMDTFREKEFELLEDVFGKNWKKLYKKDMAPLVLEKNLWYAGLLAYSLSHDVWNKLDILPKPKKYSATTLEYYSMRYYGRSANTLNDLQLDELKKWMNEIRAEDNTVTVGGFAE